MTTRTRYTGINKFIQSDALQTLFDKRHDGTFGEFIGDWKWIFSFSRKYRWIVVLYTIIGIIGSTLSLGSAYVSRILINIIVDRQTDRLWLLIGSMIGMLALSLVLSSVNSRIFTKISIYVNNDIQADIFDRILDARWKELSSYPSGDLLNRFNNDVGTIVSNAINWIPNLIVNVYMFVISFIVLFKMDVGMAWIAFLSAPFLLGMSRMIMRKQKMYRKRVLELNSGMMSFEAETFFNFEMIKSFGILGYYSRRLKDWQKKYKEYNLDYNMFSIKTNILLTVVGTGVGMVAFGYCLYRLWTGQILYGDMMFFLQQRSSLSGRFNSLVATIPGMLNSAVSAHRVRELSDLPREKHDPEAYTRVQAAAEDGLSLKLDNISFGYSDEKDVYSGMDFYAHSGEIVALLASSGGGKSTLMRIVLGMLEPDSGFVCVEDKDGNLTPVNADIRSFFAYVPQGNTILSGTIAENMRMVREDVSDDEIIEALKTACAWEFVEQIPDGINGRLGERGRGISEGQAQRLSIARALLRNAPILLLDEATSALDSETEERVLKNIIRKYPNKLILVSTHRLSVLSMCDRICRIADGRIKELDKAEAEEIIAKIPNVPEIIEGSSIDDMENNRQRQMVDKMIRESSNDKMGSEGDKDILPGQKGWWEF